MKEILKMLTHSLDNKFDRLVNMLLERQQYTITAREALYRRYGRDNAERMLSKLRAKGKDSYLEKKYILPDYSDKNLDKIIQVVFKDFKSHPFLSSGSDSIAAYGIPKGLPIKQHIGINTNSDTADYVYKELETGIPKSVVHGVPHDVLWHELLHTLQKADISKFLSNKPNNNLRYEISTVLGEIKLWYYKETGIILDADATDQDINNFINYAKQRNVFQNVAYGHKIDFEKLLRTSEGKEVFRRIVKQTPTNNTMVA